MTTMFHKAPGYILTAKSLQKEVTTSGQRENKHPRSTPCFGLSPAKFVQVAGTHYIKRPPFGYMHIICDTSFHAGIMQNDGKALAVKSDNSLLKSTVCNRILSPDWPIISFHYTSSRLCTLLQRVDTFVPGAVCKSDNFGDISRTKAYFAKQLVEKYLVKYNEQIPFKYFVN